MHTFLTPDPITVEVRNAAGAVHIDLADVTTTTVDITPAGGHPFGFIDDLLRSVDSFRRSSNSTEGSEADDPTERVRVGLQNEDAGGTLIVDSDPARDGWRSAFTIRITAPARSGVRVQTQSADVEVTGAADRLEARTASGSLTAGDVARAVSVQTASGDVRIASAGTDLDARTASGDVTVGAVGGRAVVQTTSGDIRLDRPAGDVAARSVSGDIRIADAITGTAEATAVSGDVEIGVHPGSLAAINLATVSGDTLNDFDVISDAAATQPGSGAPLSIRVKTTSGDIRLRRAAVV